MVRHGISKRSHEEMGDYDQSTIMFDLNYLFHHLLGPTSISITNTVTGKKQIVFFRLFTETVIC